MRTSLDVRRAKVRRQAGRRVRKNVGILAGQRGELRANSWGSPSSTSRVNAGERDVADEQRRAVGENRAGVRKADQRFLSPGGRGNRCERGSVPPAAERLG